MGSVGERLARERERRNISLHEISRVTKIHIRYLDAIEHEQFDQLPGGIITKGFLRAYAQEVGVEGDEIVAEYLSTLRATQMEDIPRYPESERVQHKKGRAVGHIPGWAFNGALLLLSSLIVLLLYKRELQQRPDAAEFFVRQSEHRGVRSSAVVHDSMSAQAAQTRSLADRTGLVESGVSLAALHNNTSTDAPGTSLAPGMFSVLIRVRRDAWLSITADGKRMVYQTLAAPTETSVAAHREISIRVGNTGAVDFWFNGRQLPTQGEYDEAKTLIFDANGIEKMPRNTSAATVSPEQ